ncbi:MAG: hypothetical protein LBK83_17015 [Treponema sp.]|jgi:hypothetical protein|nr:hypothetical protein [Treponema sp.]
MAERNKYPGLFQNFIYIFLFVTGLAFAQVDQAELEQNQDPVVFINYEGPQSRIETRAQIRTIGYGLGLSARNGQTSTGAGNRYFVIHSVSPKDGDKLDSDIFGLGVDTGVDHIRNLRTIIQGYLEGAYDYSPEDAALLARYVTIYNAVYRGNQDYFGSRYKQAVVGYLSPEKAGISIRFDEWPGQTLMLIPLGPGGAGSLSAVNTSSLSDSSVVEEMRRQEDRGIEDRKEMVDLTEREASEAEQRAQVQREAIREEERRIAEERSQVNQERNETAGAREETRQELAQGTISPAQAEARNEEIDRREQANEEKSRELDTREENLAERREEAGQTEEFAEQKSEEAQQQREEIAKDQQEIIIEEASRPQTAEAGILGGRIEVQGSSVGRLLSLQPGSGAELKRSPLDTVNLRTVVMLDGKILAIAGENRGNGAIRLIEINGSSLEMVKQGDIDILEGSPLWVKGNDLYAIALGGEGGSQSLYLARFDTGLKQLARSTVTVNPFASVIFQGDYLATQRTDGSPLLLKPADLSEYK